jgi:hypothetical protein
MRRFELLGEVVMESYSFLCFDRPSFKNQPAVRVTIQANKLC